MKTALIKKLSQLFISVFVLSFFVMHAGFSQSRNTPYPIIFVHGLNSDNSTWGNLDGKFDNIFDYLNGAGLQYGDNIKICLDYHLNQTGVNTPKESDVHLFTPSPHIGDYYTINFNTHADGTPSAGALTTLLDPIIDNILLVEDPTIFKVNDIISIGDELMQISSNFLGIITVKRGRFGSAVATHFPLSQVWNLSNESNQESIAKQGLAIKQAIDAIKSADKTVTKVILVGHSMGGLAIREYLKNYANNDVAKVVTIGTPHLGSNSGEISDALTAALSIDNRSNAVRDLCYNYDNKYTDPAPPYGDSPDDGVYLFGGGNELFLASETSFYSSDVNADGVLDNATGLDINMSSSLPASVDYSFIVSNWKGLNSDGLVRVLRQFPWNQTDGNGNPIIAIGDTLMTNRAHINIGILGIKGEPTDYFSLLRGLDEPSSPALAYEIAPNSTTKGFITYGTNYNPHDTDLFKINLPANGLLKVNITGNDQTGIKFVEILGADQTVIKSTNNIYQPLTDLLQAGLYYIKIIGVPSGVSIQYPYTLSVSTSTIASSLVASPSNIMNYYDELTHQSRDTIITLTNNSAVSLTISGLTLTGNNANQFSISPPLGFVVPPRTTHDIAVRFLPTSTGTKKAELNITSNSTDNPMVSVSLQGNGTPTATKKLVVTPDVSFNFGNKPISVLAAHAFTLLNTGSNNINISSLKLIGPDANQFFLSTPSVTPFSVNSNGGSVLFILNFLPASVGSKSAQLVIGNNADNKSPADTINLYGNGTNNGFTPVSGNIITYEYWFDDNYAAKIQVSVNAPNISSVNTNFSTTGLTIGSHLLHIRYQDQKGKWSSVQSEDFYKAPLSPLGARKIVAYEYWFDNNYASKVSKAITPAQISTITSNINSKALANGTHTYNIRYKDDIGEWSAVTSTIFNKSPVAPAGNRNIISYQYWFDNNYAARVDTFITPTQLASIISSVNTKSLTPGTHTYNARFKDDASQWSSVASTVFNKSPIAPTGNRNIVAYEYWFDSNYAAKVNTAVAPTKISSIMVNVDAKALTTGTHTYNIRYKDDAGDWSSVASTVYNKSPIAAGDRRIVNYEYWFDSNYKAKVSVPVVPTQTAIINSNIGITSLTGGPHNYNVRFQDDLGRWSSVVTDTVKVLSNNANLANLKVNNGTIPLTPVFNYNTTVYTASVPNATTTIKVTPVLADTTARVKANGTSVKSGTASASLPLVVGANTVNVVVTAQNGITAKTYIVTVTRAPSANANLSNLSLSSGTLTPPFASGTTGYTASVNTASVTLTPTASDTTAAVKVNGKTVSSGKASAAIPLTIGQNTITTIVTAQDGTTINTYTVIVTRLSTNTNLTNLKISSGILSPAFHYTTTAYTASVPNAVTTINVTPFLSDPTASVKVNGIATASGKASVAIPLNAGPNIINTGITAQDGVTMQTYSIIVTRAPSTNASLADLTLSAGTLSPAFATGTTSYTALVNATSITVTPTTGDATATVKVNGNAVTSGTASTALPLTIGQNTITTVVTAQDGTTTSTYTITITRLSNNANLANLKVNSGNIPLTPLFNYNTTGYTGSVTNATATIKVTPVTSDVNATVKVNGVTVPSGTQSASLPLLVGASTITTIVTAQDGATTRTYTITVTRAAPVRNLNETVSVANPTENPQLETDGITMHPAISPNGDGQNDFLIIDGIANHPESKLTIMNRNGQLVFEANGYNNTTKVFDGHSNKTGAKQLPGTYFYSLDYTVKGIKKHKTGFIVLKW